MMDFLLDPVRRRKVLYLTAIFILIIAIIVLLTEFSANKKASKEKAAQDSVSIAGEEKLYDNAEPIQEIVTVDTEIVQDGLRDMGELITEEYYFTQVEEYTNKKKVFILDSTASFTYSYDGVVTAGIDCNDVTISKDDEKKTVTITIPQAEIFSVNIDHDSFKVFEEKDGLFNKADLKMYNNSMIKFEDAAREKAKEKGIIEKAGEGAEKMIYSFAQSLINNDEYKIEVVQK